MVEARELGVRGRESQPEAVLSSGLWRLFPGDDAGARSRLQRWLGSRRGLDYECARKIVRRRHPHAGFVHVNLPSKRLAENGHLA